VHLYSRYLSETQIEEINKKLVKADFIVKPNYLEFPKSINKSTLTYSPVIKERNAVDKVIHKLSDIGWEIHHTSMLFIDNHWYKENSIALMLLPPGVEPQAQTHQQDWANDYSSENCDLGLTINLGQNGQYQIVTAKNLPLNRDYATGIWEISNFPYLELRAKNSNWAFFMELSTRMRPDHIGEVYISELTPMTHYLMFAGCTFVHGIRK
jgi:hypothetical protein